MQDTDEPVDSTSKVLVPILMSVSLANKENSLKLEQHIWKLGCANRICGESGSFRRHKHGAALLRNPDPV